MKNSSDSVLFPQLLVSQKMVCESRPIIIKMTPLEGLTYLDQNISKDDYISMCLIIKSRGADTFPAYAAITAIKTKCKSDHYHKRSV